MKLTLIGAAASVALVSATAIAFAQGPGGMEPPGKMQGPGSQGPGAQGPGTHGPGSQGPAMKQPDGKVEGPRATGKGEAQRAPDATHGKSTKESQSVPGKKEQPKATERQPDKTQPKATERAPEKAQPKATERAPDKTQPKATERAPEKSQPKATERRPDGNQKSTQGRSQGRVQVSEEQRGGVRERLLKDGRHQKTRLNITVNVGARVPHSVRLLPLPVAIVDFAPAYRGYDYIVLEDETICIVEPRSHEIVDLIPAGTQRAERSQRPTLSLSQEQMRFIAANVPREPSSDVRVRLALGAEVPRDVELLSFPRAVTSQVPEIEAFSYVVSENDVVVVDPRERAVILVITD